jgi:hypothetical protein
MSKNTLTTDRLRESVRARFTAAPVELSDGTEVLLAPLTRMDETRRKAVVAALEDFAELPTDDESDETNQLATEALETLLRLIADRPLELIADAKDDDPLIYSNLLGEIVQYWGKETRLGEAQNSVV